MRSTASQRPVLYLKRDDDYEDVDDDDDDDNDDAYAQVQRPQARKVSIALSDHDTTESDF